MKNLLFLLFSVTLLTACGDDQLETDIDLIEQYLADNGIEDFEQDDSGLFYKIDSEGNGSSPNLNSEVTVNYVGTFLDGTEFDSGNNITFPLFGVILGWQIGIPKLEKGGSGRLFIPSELAYGEQGRPGIPSNAVLIFDIDLIDF